jgi:predicted metallopeptidase
MKWEKAVDIQRHVGVLIGQLQLKHIDKDQVFCFRSFGSKSRAMARIWALPRIWQMALNSKPGYCLEVISERYDRLSYDNQKKVLIHELLHIPKNFSGSLLSHRSLGGKKFSRNVEDLWLKLKNTK